MKQSAISQLLGSRLRHVRRLCDLSRRQVALELNVTERAVQNWENGSRHPSDITLTHLAHVLCHGVNRFSATEEQWQKWLRSFVPTPLGSAPKTVPVTVVVAGRPKRRQLVGLEKVFVSAMGPMRKAVRARPLPSDEEAASLLQALCAQFMVALEKERRRAERKHDRLVKLERGGGQVGLPVHGDPPKAAGYG